MNATVKEIKQENGVGVEVITNDGRSFPCDMIVVGAGVIPATKFVKGVALERDQSLVCDEFMHVKGTDGLYASGDIARFPLKFLHGESARIEHWGYAQYEGKVAALNMIGHKKEMDSVPFFWTVMFNKSIRYTGHALKYDEVIFDKPETGFEYGSFTFAAYYSHEGRIVSCTTRDLTHI